MIKILHCADWHLDAPMALASPEQRALLRHHSAQIPYKIAALCQQHNCDLLLISGDLFDGSYAADTLQSLKNALAQVQIPVFIAPGNHDYVSPDSPWLTETFTDNVHIFTHAEIESVAVEQLNCRVYGAGFQAMDCPGLLAGFTAECAEKYAVGVLHGDPTQVNSPYCPITTEQVKNSGLQYLALGHIHKADQFRTGKTLCAWPGCPMGQGYDETGEKGVLLVTLDETASAEFIPLDTPRFYDWELPASHSLDSLLPPVGNENFYRITFTGPSEPLDLEAIRAGYPQFPNLTLRDQTTPPVDIWGSAQLDTLEGLYFSRLRKKLDAGEEKAALAAQISRQLLDGQEVVLP